MLCKSDATHASELELVLLAAELKGSTFEEVRAGILKLEVAPPGTCLVEHSLLVDTTDVVLTTVAITQ